MSRYHRTPSLAPCPMLNWSELFWWQERDQFYFRQVDFMLWLIGVIRKAKGLSSVIHHIEHQCLKTVSIVRGDFQFTFAFHETVNSIYFFRHSKLSNSCTLSFSTFVLINIDWPNMPVLPKTCCVLSCCDAALSSSLPIMRAAQFLKNRWQQVLIELQHCSIILCLVGMIL